jgi:hypothetical protein
MRWVVRQQIIVYCLFDRFDAALFFRAPYVGRVIATKQIALLRQILKRAQ